MSQATELIAQQMASGASVANIWGNIVINVKFYGAKGNGGTDDTAAIQKAINYAISIGKHEITFPAGIYKYGVLTNTSGISFIGDGVTLNGITPLNRQLISEFNNWGITILENYDMFRVDTGNYGISNEFHGGAKVVSSISGAISVPANAINAPNQANGVVGYGKSANPYWNAVGGYFQGQAGANSTLAWGTNPLVEDCGFNNVNLWGCEVNVNVTNASTVARGIDIIGGSSVQPSIGIALRIGPLGTFTVPFIKWTEGIRTADGATNNAIVIGSKENGISDSQRLIFRGRYGVEGQYNECIMESTAGGVFYMTSPNNGFMTFRGQAQLTQYDALTVIGNKVGIMTNSCQYTLQVNGDAQLSGMFACNGATPRGKQAVNAAATDLATTTALLNQMRTALLNNGICI